MIFIIDYGMGNSGSILNMIKRAGGAAVVTTRSEDIKNAKALILPGVGAFDNGMIKLKSSGMIDAVKQKILEYKTPFLGICLGMQLLLEHSEEGAQPGLGLIAGSVKRFDFSDCSSGRSLKIPHMGWNEVRIEKKSNLFSGLEDEARFYFVHSYHAVCKNAENILATSNYGYDFPCAVQHENIFGVQFHPEKSHRFGVTLFKNFLEVVKCYTQE